MFHALLDGNTACIKITAVFVYGSYVSLFRRANSEILNFLRIKH